MIVASPHHADPVSCINGKHMIKMMAGTLGASRIHLELTRLVESPVEECNAGHAEYCKCECCRGRPHSIVSRPLNSNLGFSVVLTDGS